LKEKVPLSRSVLQGLTVPCPEKVFESVYGDHSNVVCIDKIHLKMESSSDQPSHSLEIFDGTSSSFECNICFDEAKQPLATQCGHLYCFLCLTKWISIGGNDCPVCKSRLLEDSIIHLYGRGRSNSSGGTRRDPPPFLQVHGRSNSNPGGLLRGFSSIPFVQVSELMKSSGYRRLGVEQQRQTSISRFLIGFGILLIIFILSL
jgi:hypothetical protein